MVITYERLELGIWRS